MDTFADRNNNLDERLTKIESLLTELVRQRTVKDWYGTAEFAQTARRAEFTVREWCRNGRVHAEKQGSGRSKYQSWVISHAEVQRFQKEGLLPQRKS